jgi:hypothetical protein
MGIGGTSGYAATDTANSTHVVRGNILTPSSKKNITAYETSKTYRNVKREM